MSLTNINGHLTTPPNDIYTRHMTSLPESSESCDDDVNSEMFIGEDIIQMLMMLMVE